VACTRRLRAMTKPAAARPLEDRIVDAEARLREAEVVQQRIDAADAFTDAERAAVHAACDRLRLECGELADAHRRRETVVGAQLVAVHHTLQAREAILNGIVDASRDDLFPLFREEHLRLQSEEQALHDAREQADAL